MYGSHESIVDEVFRVWPVGELTQVNDRRRSASCDARSSAAMFNVDLRAMAKLSVLTSLITFLSGFKPPGLLIPAKEHHASHTFTLTRIAACNNGFDVRVELNPMCDGHFDQS